MGLVGSSVLDVPAPEEWPPSPQACAVLVFASICHMMRQALCREAAHLPWAADVLKYEQVHYAVKQAPGLLLHP